MIWFILGIALFGPAISERRMRPLVGWALALMAGGLTVPLTSALVPVLAITIAAGAATTGAWIAVELRQRDA